MKGSSFNVHQNSQIFFFLPSDLSILLNVARNPGAFMPTVLSTCIRDLTTSVGKMADQRHMPPTPPATIVLAAPKKSRDNQSENETRDPSNVLYFGKFFSGGRGVFQLEF